MDRRRTDQNPDKFRDLLMGAAQGLALFHPSLDVEYGGAVGDCGYMESGRFWKLFNIFDPPPGMPGLPPPQRGSRRTEALPNNGVLTSSNTSSFSLRGGLPFSSPPFEIDASLNVSRNEASVAFLAYGGQSHEVDVWRDTKVMKDYLLANEDLIVRTYDMTPVATCGVLLVFGTTRVNAWCGGVAHALGTSVQAKIKVTLAGIDVVELAATNEVTQQGATTQADWAITRGPLDPAYDSTSHKYCVIVRPVVVRKRERLWKRATTLLEVRSSSGSYQQPSLLQNSGSQTTTPAASSTAMSSSVGQPSTSSSSPQESDAGSSSTLSDDKYEEVSPNLLAEILDTILVDDNTISAAVADWGIVSTYALAYKRLPDASCKKIYHTRVAGWHSTRIADVTALLPEDELLTDTLHEHCEATCIPIGLPTALPRASGETYSPIAHLPLTSDAPQVAPQLAMAHLSVPPLSSEWVMWVGNVPSDASEAEVRQFFDSSRRPRDDKSLGGESEIMSVVVVSRSNCAFVNFRTAAGLKDGVQSFNGLPLRPTDPRCPRLLCRARNQVDTLYAGVAGLRGTDGSRWRNAPSSSGSTSSGPYTSLSDSSSYASTMSTVSSSNSSFLAKHFPIRYFIMKSLSEQQLLQSVQHNLWSTQEHNEMILDHAYRNSKDVFLIFSANRSGEFFGYARMAGPIAPRVKAPILSALMEGVKVPPSSWSTTDTLVDSRSPLALDDDKVPEPNEQFLTEGKPPVTSISEAHHGVRERKLVAAGADTAPPVLALSSTAGDPLLKYGAGKEQEFGTPFNIEWLRIQRVPFQRTKHLRNPWNNDREVKVARDGTELEPTVGARLLEEWNRPEDTSPPPQAQSHRVHTGERNHACPYPGCNTRCSRQDNLQQHYSVHLSPNSRNISSSRAALARTALATVASPLSMIYPASNHHIPSLPFTPVLVPTPHPHRLAGGDGERWHNTPRHPPPLASRTCP